MTPLADVRGPSAPDPAGGATWLFLRLCTSNPFYVISAGLFLAGLRISFGDPAAAEDTWAMMTGLAGYTLLLAVTACLLVRFGNVWDDLRTVMLLVVLMFLVTSVMFDEVLVLDPARGFACYLGGLLLAVAVSEGLLRGTRLRLPAWFRGPYYLILALFFLYPLALSPLLAEPHSEELMWGLFGFSTAAGLAFLTLLPAVRRGPDYVRGNGSPWPWPLYPWSLFGLLAFAVLGRAFLLCWSMQVLVGADRGQLVFGPYFLVPFGLAVAVLLLEMGIVSGRGVVHGVALAIPAALVGLALVGHRSDPIYQQFLEAFAARLGGDPLFLTVLAVTGFYVYAVLRGVPLATEALTAALVALAVVGPETLSTGRLAEPRPEPILAAAALQLILGLRHHQAWRCLLGAAGPAVVAALALPRGNGATLVQGLIAFHLVVAAVLTVGAAFDDIFARLLRGAGAVLVLLACLAAVFGRFTPPAGLPTGVLEAYPFVMAAALAAYGYRIGHRFSLAAATLVVACWLVAVVGRGYLALRLVVAGLDYLALSLTLFAVAVLVSLGKSGALSRWAAARTGRVPDSTE